MTFEAEQSIAIGRVSEGVVGEGVLESGTINARFQSDGKVQVSKKN